MTLLLVQLYIIEGILCNKSVESYACWMYLLWHNGPASVIVIVGQFYFYSVLIIILIRLDKTYPIDQ